VVEKLIDQSVCSFAVRRVAVSGLAYELVQAHAKSIDLVGAAGRDPGSENLRIHLGMKLHGKVAVKDKGL
jgi:hypothetical protein